MRQKSRGATPRNGSEAPRSTRRTAPKSRKFFRLGIRFATVVISFVAILLGYAQAARAEKPMTRQELNERLREIGNSRFGEGMRVASDTDQAKNADVIAQRLHELTEDGREVPEHPEPRLLECTEYKSLVQHGLAFTVCGSVSMPVVYDDLDGIIEGVDTGYDSRYYELEERIAADEKIELANYFGKPRVEREPKIYVNGKPLGVFLNELYGLDEMGSQPFYWWTPDEYHDAEERRVYPAGWYAHDYDYANYLGDEALAWDLDDPPIRKSKGRKPRGGSGPGNHVSPTVAVAAPKALKVRKRLAKEFWREIRRDPDLFDALCENCRRQIPHTDEGRTFLIATLIAEAASQGREARVVGAAA